MSKIRIVGAIASQAGITLYLENGNEVNLKKDTRRTKAILDDVVGALARREIVELDLETFSVEHRIEKKTGGLIRFVREKVNKIASLFTSTALTVEEPPVPAANPFEDEDDELVAYVGKTRIPGVAALETQMEHAAYTDNIVGFTRFMERIAAVIAERGHSVEELLNFMSRGDLPIANDGSIIAYKVLVSAEGDTFVDRHSGKVIQRLGSRVSMDAKLVDPSRRTECSTGLHIARRGYLRGFGGNVIVMVKVNPEDVIAVPSGEPDKMRAAAYHIVAVIPAEVHATLRANQPMTEHDVASKILADVIAGNHISIIEEVVIGAEKGGDLRIEAVKNAAEAPTPFQNGMAQTLDSPHEVVSIRDVKQAIKTAAALQPEPIAALAIASETASQRRNRVKREKRAAARSASLGAEAVVPAAPATEKKPIRAANGNKLPLKHQQALELHAQGLSARTIEKELHICRKTLRKLLNAA